MTFLERMAVYVTTLSMIIIYIGVALLPPLLFYLTHSGWWFALYVLILPALLIVAAIIDRMAKDKKAGRQ